MLIAFCVSLSLSRKWHFPDKFTTMTTQCTVDSSYRKLVVCSILMSFVKSEIPQKIFTALEIVWKNQSVRVSHFPLKMTFWHGFQFILTHTSDALLLKRRRQRNKQQKIKTKPTIYLKIVMKIMYFKLSIVCKRHSFEKYLKHVFFCRKKSKETRRTDTQLERIIIFFSPISIHSLIYIATKVF